MAVCKLFAQDLRFTLLFILHFKISNHNSKITTHKYQTPEPIAQSPNQKSQLTNHKLTLNTRNPGTLEPWNIGTLELWNAGTFEPVPSSPNGEMERFFTIRFTLYANSTILCTLNPIPLFTL